MTSAIIFDCFGVLVTDGWTPFKYTHFGNDSEKFGRAVELNHLVDNALISYDEFLREIGDMAGVNPQEVDAMCKSAVPNKPLLGVARQLKQNYKIGMLSNVSGDWLETMFTKEDIELFDAIGLSYEMGVSKPDPRSYEIISERLETAPEHCLFIDDQPAYVAAAQEQGMQGITYQGYEALVNSLQEKGIKISK